MTAQELLDIIRADYLDDAAIGLDDPDEAESVARWKTPFLLREIGRAQVEATHRQDLRHLFDDSTPAICSVTLAEGVASYALDRRILRIARAQIVGCALELEHLTEAQLDERRPGWRSAAAGTPEAFVVMGRKLVLYPPPALSSATAGLSLAVYREPLLAALVAADTLEWADDPERLAHWVAGRAFLRPDETTFNAKLAAEHLARFDAAFGKEVGAQARAELLAYPGAVSMNWCGGRNRGRITSRGGGSSIA